MNLTDWHTERLADPAAAPLRVPPTRCSIDEALRDCPRPPTRRRGPTGCSPPRSATSWPTSACGTTPSPRAPAHLEQTLAVLRRYGRCRTQNTTVIGRLCIRDAQQLLEKTGHVTPTARERAVAYMQAALAEAGVHMSFFTWNDLPDEEFSAVETLTQRAAHLARQNGE
ncbi:hypothetical protein SANTM175S_04262 [Streptomyces antimycoticus]